MAHPVPALDGVTVLDFATVGPAARCSRILADYGARVVKVGAPPRRAGVQIEPAWWAYSAGRGTRRLRVDLKVPEGRDAFLRLAAGADVVIESFRPGVVARLGIGYEDVKRVNRRIVYCSTSGYGQSGPAASWAGHDLDYLAVAGFLHCSGRREDGVPPLPGATLADSAGGGMHAALAILAALLRRAKTGEGEYLDVAVADGVLQLMALHVDQYLATGEEPGPGRDILTGRYACYGVYPARDGGLLAVAAIEPAFFANLCKALRLERWTEHQTDDAVQDEIRADLRAAFAKRDRDDWVAELAPANTCVAPVLSVAELARAPQFAARGAFVELVRPDGTRGRQVGPVLAGSSAVRAPVAARDPAASDSEELLLAAGLAENEIETLRQAGVVG
jgi:alpha-methylacyl-CoA racemase